MADRCEERHHRHYNVWNQLVYCSAHQVLTKRRLFSYGLNTGGPGVMSIGWIIVSFFSMHRFDAVYPSEC